MHFPAFLRFWARLFVCVSLLFATPLAHAKNTSVLDDVLDRGALRVGFSSFVPWAMRGKGGEFIGFEIDVARQLAQEMDVELELVPTAWDGIIPALLTKKFDVIIGGMFITPQRNLQINFTIPYDETGLGMVANKKLTAGMRRLEDYNREDVVFALRRGAYPVTYVQTNMPRAKIVQFDDDSTARQELINGRAHAWVASEPEPTFSALDYPNILHRPFNQVLGATQLQGMGVRKGDADILNFLNNWITLKKQSGWLQQRHNYWFGGRDWKTRLGE